MSKTYKDKRDRKIEDRGKRRERHPKPYNRNVDDPDVFDDEPDYEPEDDLVGDSFFVRDHVVVPDPEEDYLEDWAVREFDWDFGD